MDQVPFSTECFPQIAHMAGRGLAGSLRNLTPRRLGCFSPAYVNLACAHLLAVPVLFYLSSHAHATMDNWLQLLDINSEGNLPQVGKNSVTHHSSVALGDIVDDNRWPCRDCGHSQYTGVPGS